MKGDDATLFTAHLAARLVARMAPHIAVAHVAAAECSPDRAAVLPVRAMRLRFLLATGDAR